jgi:anti-sigma B factor antagonist
MQARDEPRETAPLEMSHVILPSGVALINLGGDLDVVSAKAATGYVRDVIRQHNGPVVLDVAAVTYCDAQGLSALLRMREFSEQEGCPFRLSTPSPALVKKMRMTGIDHRFLLSPRDPPNRYLS